MLWSDDCVWTADDSERIRDLTVMVEDVLASYYRYVDDIHDLVCQAYALGAEAIICTDVCPDGSLALRIDHTLTVAIGAVDRKIGVRYGVRCTPNPDNYGLLYATVLTIDGMDIGKLVDDGSLRYLAENN